MGMKVSSDKPAGFIERSHPRIIDAIDYRNT
jgi:hypothetical protein